MSKNKSQEKKAAVAKAVAKKAKKNRPEVQVVVASSGFPISSRPSAQRKPPPARPTTESLPRPQQDGRSEKKNKSNPLILDLNEAKKEVRSYGATAFVGKQKKSFQDEQYKLLTGRDRKQPKMPPNIARLVRKKALAREEKMIAEAKQAGFVLPKSALESQQEQKRKKSSQRQGEWNGPAPSVGFTKDGVLKLTKKPF